MKTVNYYLAAALVMALSLSGCKNEDKDAIPMSDLEKGIIEIPCADGKTRQVVDLGIPFGTLWANVIWEPTVPKRPEVFLHGARHR